MVGKVLADSARPRAIRLAAIAVGIPIIISVVSAAVTEAFLGQFSAMTVVAVLVGHMRPQRWTNG